MDDCTDWEAPDLHGDAFRHQLSVVAANRHSAEAAGLYRVLFDYASQRVGRLAQRTRISPTQREEVVGDVLLSLMKGSLASFRGGSLPELLAFVRTITDRTTWKVLKRARRERELAHTDDQELVQRWHGQAPGSPGDVELDIDSPLPEADQEYLISLLRAGTKAKLARATGVSRAAVTQRVTRILQRVADLHASERMAHEAWLENAARAAVARFD